MADSPSLPGVQGWKDAQGRPLPVEFFRFLRDLVAYVAQAQGETLELAELEARVAELEAGGSFSIQGQQSVRVVGMPNDGLVQLFLQGDEAAPAASLYYGTDETGAKGFHALPSAGNWDGGNASSLYGGTTAIDGGGA